MNKFETYLEKTVLDGIPSYTKQAMHYSLMNGGKRVRPTLLFDALIGYGIQEDVGYPCACAIEMIHTYSLIHDDLPAMDNDDFRRGNPSCHKAYTEATAILAGDGLLTRAFQVALQTECSAEQKVRLIDALSQYAGIDGMIYGQTLDLAAETDTEPSVEKMSTIHLYKTSKLLTLPLVCAAIIANHMEDIDTLISIGTDLGIEFQIQDDILDVTSSPEIMGKSLSDADNSKMTAVKLMGLEKAQQAVEQYDAKIREKLSMLHMNTSFLENTFNYLIHRTY